jgi:hypothetical protein
MNNFMSNDRLYMMLQWDLYLDFDDLYECKLGRKLYDQIADQLENQLNDIFQFGVCELLDEELTDGE